MDKRAASIYLQTEPGFDLGVKLGQTRAAENTLNGLTVWWGFDKRTTTTGRDRWLRFSFGLSSGEVPTEKARKVANDIDAQTHRACKVISHGVLNEMLWRIPQTHGIAPYR